MAPAPILLAERRLHLLKERKMALPRVWVVGNLSIGKGMIASVRLRSTNLAVLVMTALLV